MIGNGSESFIFTEVPTFELHESMTEKFDVGLVIFPDIIDPHMGNAGVYFVIPQVRAANELLRFSAPAATCYITTYSVAN